MENLINFIFNTSELRVIFTTPSRLSKNCELKDKIKEIEKQSLVVYHIRCSEYDADYIRKTARIFQYRMNEHSSSNAGNKYFSCTTPIH